MSRFQVHLDYRGRLWLDDEDSLRTISWDSNTATFGTGGVNLTTEVDIGPEEQRGLVAALARNPPGTPPHWQSVPSELHATVLRIEEALRTAARSLDSELRRAGGSIRLPAYGFRRVPPQQTPNWSTVQWTYSDAERTVLAPVLQELEGPQRAAYESGISIPLPAAFEGRQLYMAGAKIDAVGEALRSDMQATPPCYALYGVAWQNFENRSVAAAVVVLAVALETALKWYLGTKGDPIANYLLENVQSPPLAKLASCARTQADLRIPRRYQKWLADLTKTRNEVVHRADSREPNPLEVARWFAVGEAVLAALDGVEVDPLIGALVSVSSVVSRFPAGTRGVVLRREVTHGSDVYHVLLDTGVTRKFAPGSFEDLGDEAF